MPSIEVDMAKRRLLFFHCGSVAEMEQVAAQRLAQLTSAWQQLTAQQKTAWTKAEREALKGDRRELNRQRYLINQWLTGKTQNWQDVALGKIRFEREQRGALSERATLSPARDACPCA